MKMIYQEKVLDGGWFLNLLPRICSEEDNGSVSAGSVVVCTL